MTYKPNYQNIVDVALNRKPQRIPLYEHYVSYNMIEKITNTQLSRYYWGTSEELRLMFANYTAFFRDYGYDAVSFECCVTDILPHGGALSGSGKGCIDSQETFDAYPWESVKELYINRFKPYFDALAESMPDGMKAIGGVGNGVFEIVQDLVGYENLCIFSFEEPELYASLFEKVGQILYEIWQWFLKNYSDVYCVCRFGDDLGYKSNTLLSHEDIRKHIIPQYARIVDLVHQYGRPFLLHSCGKIFAVDVRHDVGTGQAEQVVVSLHLPGYFFKEFAAEIGLCQVVSLYHGAHRTVKNKDASAHQVFQFHKIGFIV